MSNNERLDTLLHGVHLRSSRPTEMLRKLKRLMITGNDKEVEIPLLKKFFIDKLPNDVRRLLAATGEIDQDILAKRADDIVATPTTSTTSFPRARNVWNNYPRHKNELCFYHNKFGHHANKCVLPCTWHRSRESQSNFHQDCTNPRIDKVGAIGLLGSLIKIQDPITKIDFLVDTGSTISLLPNCFPQSVPPTGCLRAINDTQTYPRH